MKNKRTFDHLALRVGLASLDDLVVGGVQLKAVRLVAVLHLTQVDVLKRDDSLRLLVLLQSTGVTV